MDSVEEELRQKDLRKLFFDLAKTQDILQTSDREKAIYERLERIYYSPPNSQKFHHLYSEIFSILAQITRDPALGNIDILGQNLSLLRANYKPEKQDEMFIDITDCLRKLYDHVNLDIARLNYSKEIFWKASGGEEYITLHEQMQCTEKNFSEQLNAISTETREKAKKLEIRLRGLQKEYIAILGIFAAIMLSFTAGITFSNSVFQNIDKASIYRLAFVVSLIGVVLINILFGLFYYINHLVRDENKRASAIPLLISNGVFFIIMGMTVCFWYVGEIEGRNIKISEQHISGGIINAIINFFK